MRRAIAAVVALAATAVLAGCGGDDGERLTVSAASSLKVALPKYEPSARYSFAGSDELAAQIRAGARPDVFAAANTKLPQALFDEGLVERPRVFATNRLVLAVPAGSTKVRMLSDLVKPHVTIAAGAPAVPVGSYTREVIDRIPGPLGNAIEKHIRSNEPDVSGVVGKLTQGAVDAGFVYATDVKATAGRLRAIELPAGLQPRVAYAAAVVKGGKQTGAARRFLDDLGGANGRAALTAAGFGVP